MASVDEQQTNTRSIAAGVFWGLLLFFVALPLAVGLLFAVCAGVYYVASVERPVELAAAPGTAPPIEISEPPEDAEPAEPEPRPEPEQPPPTTDKPRKAQQPPGMAPPAAEPEPWYLGRFGAKLIDVSSLDDARRAELEIPSSMLGVLVLEVRPESAAAKAGVHEGDVIVEISYWAGVINSSRVRDTRLSVDDAAMFESVISDFASPGFLTLRCWRQAPNKNDSLLAPGGGERRLVKLLVRL